MSTRVLSLLLLGLAGGLWVGCTGGKEAGETAAEEKSARPSTAPTPELAPSAPTARTIQLYRGEDERSLPVVEMQGEGTLTLEFDLMTAEGRPLTAHFFHADRTWRRDLSPSRALVSYSDDSIVEYRSSQGTEVDYTHYTYQFPNDDIRFRVSGNYVLRVTERGHRDSVLFERAFFVTEEAGDLRTGADAFSIPGQSQASLRPVARYTPPAALQGDPFSYTACFVRNGQLRERRCEDRPLLTDQPQLEFEVQRSRAFDPLTADRRLDLGDLRSSPSIERLDRTVSPLRALLEPDYARFTDAGQTPLLNGQIVVRGAVQGRADPALTAEYVRTTFAFVPDGDGPVQGGVRITGSFGDRDEPMEWVPQRTRYEGELLLKQGQYQYAYALPDAARPANQAQPLLRESLYTTFVYYRDPSRGTDRLLRVQQFQR